MFDSVARWSAGMTFWRKRISFAKCRDWGESCRSNCLPTGCSFLFNQRQTADIHPHRNAVSTVYKHDRMTAACTLDIFLAYGGQGSAPSLELSAEPQLCIRSRIRSRTQAISACEMGYLSKNAKLARRQPSRQKVELFS